MSLTSEFVPLELTYLRREAAVMKAEGWRFIQTHAVNTDDGVDLYYSFMKNGLARNYRISGVKKGTPVPSITDLFLAAFVFENEARELFGVDMRDIALDFQGAMYAPAEMEPMTFITPEQKAAREKAKKAAAAQAQKEERADGEQAEDAAKPAGTTRKRIFVMTPELQKRLDARYPNLSDEKKAKVDAALAARKAEAEAAAQASQAAAEDTEASVVTAKEPEGDGATPKPEQAAEHVEKKIDAALEGAIALMDPQKAAKVRAALSGKAIEEPAKAPGDEVAASEGGLSDDQLEHLIGLMDDAKAAKVREAFASKGGE